MDSLGDSETRSSEVKSTPDDMFVNEDIATIDAKEIPEHDLLCGGFPCQDYSVAKLLDKSAGLEGKKGVLWWKSIELRSITCPNIYCWKTLTGYWDAFVVSVEEILQSCSPLWMT